ncbi:type II secretion system F family protein [Sphingobium sp. H39-3-25]|uniref:type II secretion system F family protein n=1 Tax=Sphingobium arseniciresistens TaxID=3030834 RepID=UPI0023B972B2|nr:type II secretion system F family protein [Sphingobium arseniciresistens]
MNDLLASRPLFLAIVFLLVVGGVMLASAIVNRNVAVRRRLEEMGVAGGGGAGDTTGQMSLRATRASTEWRRIVDRIEKSGISLVDTNNEKLRKRLAAAGYNTPEAPRIFTLLRMVLTLVLPAILVALSLTSSQPPSLFKLYVFGVGVALVGLYLPNLWISARAGRRQEAIVNGFPDALDLLLVCVEAGLGLEAALDRVGREMSLSHPLVSQMLGKVVLELRAGRSRSDALRRMADDVEIDEIRAFSTLLIQSDQLGTSVGQTLRVYAGEMREKRRMRAEEKAHKLPVLLSIPLVACMLPVMIGVLMLPAMIRVVRTLLPAMGGGS